MSFDAHKNFAYSTVATAPSPASSGTSLVVAAGDGAKFPAAPFNATVWPAGVQPTSDVAEIVRVTAIATDTFTITRTQESTSARSITVGDQIAATITAKTITDIEGGTVFSYKTADYSGSSGFFNVPVDTGGSTAHSTAILAADAITFDGSTEVCIEFFTLAEPDYLGFIAFELYDGSTYIETIADATSPTANVSSQQRGGKTILTRRYITPTAGSHTYSVRAWAYTGTHNYLFAGTNTLGAGTTTPDALTYLRVINSRAGAKGPPGDQGPAGVAGSNADKGCRLYKSGTQALTDSTVTAITFDSEHWDTDSMHSTVSNTSRITCVTAGKYDIGGAISYASNATGFRQCRITLNGTTVIAFKSETALSGASHIVATNTVWALAVGDYVELGAFQSSGGSLNAQASASYATEFWAQLIAAT